MNIDKVKEIEKKISRDYNNIVGITIFQNNEKRYEKAFNGNYVEDRVHVYSVTKSIISILIGIAIDEGYIKSIHQRVLEFFPEHQLKDNSALNKITIENMLTMTTPYKYKILPPYLKYFTTKDWVKFSLDQIGKSKYIGQFRYAPLIGPDILSGILVKATGKSVLEYAQEKLFGPLEINVENHIIFHSKEEQLAFNQAKNISGWVADSQGINSAGWGLCLTSQDMAKLGLLYLNHGKWNGKQVVSRKWIEESTKEHSRWEKENLSYGYLWWVDHEGYAAMGDGGNIIYINIEKNLVIAITALFKKNVTDRIMFIKEYIEPIFEKDFKD